MLRATTVAVLVLSACEGAISIPGPGSVLPGGGGAGGGVTMPPPDTRVDCSHGPYPAQLESRRLTVAQYQNAIRDVFGGKVTASAHYPGIYGKPLTGFTTEPAINDVGEQGAEEVVTAGEDVALSVAGALSQLLPCSVSKPDDACVDTFIDRFVARAWRRPLASAERDVLRGIYQGGRTDGATFSESVAMVAETALLSPQFLYVTEAASPAPGRPLDDYELAARLSFFLWDSVPDDALLALAQNGQLKDPVVRADNARRMLEDSRADATLSRLFREWTQTAVVSKSDKAPDVLPGFDDAYAASMAQSFDRFVADQARHGTLTSLLTSDEAWVDARMAGFFKVAAPASGWAKVKVTGAGLSGLGTQPEFLASAAHPADSSYVYRGRFFRKRLVCTDLGSPPANAQSAFAALQLPADATGKEKSEAVRANGTCGACHSLIDPIGLSLEGFDAVGHPRTMYASGRTIDTSGSAPVDDHAIKFDSFAPLSAALAREPVVATCVSRQLVRFTYSRPDGTTDACTVQAIADALGGQGTLADALVAVVSNDTFQWRIDP